MNDTTQKGINEKIKECRRLVSSEKIIACLEELLKTTNDGMVSYVLGQEYEKLGNDEIAIQHYEKAESLFTLPEFKNMARSPINRLKVKSILDDRKLGVSPDSVEVLWTVTSFGTNDSFSQVSDVDVDLHQSLIYVTDSGNNRVLAFDFDGKLLDILGKKGQGPGEFLNPTGLFALDDSRLAVADFNNNRIQIFDRSGNLWLSTKAKDTRVADLIILEDKIYTISAFGTSGYKLDFSPDKETQPLLTVLDIQGNKIHSITGNAFPDPHPFLRAIKNRVCLAVSREKKIYLSYFAANLIQAFDDSGKKLDEFQRPLPFDPILPKLSMQEKDSKGEVLVGANFDYVTQDSSICADNNLYLLTYAQSNVERHKEKKKKNPPHPMRIDVIEPITHKILRYIYCDPGTKAFSVMEEDRMVYIYEDEKGKKTLKCIKAL